MLLLRPLLPAVRRALRAVRDPYVPILAHLVVTRRCNLACGYCTEYDHVSAPVPVAQLTDRLDRLAELGTIVVTLSGGEPLLHPALDQLVKHVVSRGMVCTTITNGYPLTRTWVRRLNAARLTLLQISIDNMEPTATSQKSWSRLGPRLALLRDNARFGVNVNAVLGSGSMEATRQVAAEVERMGFYLTLGLLHGTDGQLDTPDGNGGQLAELLDGLTRSARRSWAHRVGHGWEASLLRGGRAPWKCRAGGRYLYVDEDGIVSYCSQRRGDPGIALVDYDRAALARGFHTTKECARACTIGCVRRASSFDQRRPRWGTRPLEVPLSAPSGTSCSTLRSRADAR